MNSTVAADAGADRAKLPYIDGLLAALRNAEDANRESLQTASALVADVLLRDGIVYVFGSGHSQLAALELSRRAGVIAPLQVLFDATWGAAEDVEGFAATLLAETAMGPDDCLIAISNSGRTAAAIEVARHAASRGTPVIAVTSAAVSAAVPARHSSGLKLYQAADVVLDTVAGDCALTLPGIPDRVGPTSTLVAAALLHELVVEAVRRVAAAGKEPALYRANSEPGGREHNAALRARFRGRVRLVP